MAKSTVTPLRVKSTKRELKDELNESSNQIRRAKALVDVLCGLSDRDEHLESLEPESLRVTLGVLAGIIDKIDRFVDAAHSLADRAEVANV